MKEKIKVVLHEEQFGSFSLTPRMVQMLQARGCEWVGKCSQPAEGENYTLPSEFSALNQDNKLRRDPNLIAVIETLMREYDDQTNYDLGWQCRALLRQKLLANLKVVEITVAINVFDQDGRETVQVTGGLW